jgi:PadR family transcriptional regulator PadR
MDQNIRLTGTTMRVLAYFLDNIGRGISGAEIYKETGMATGTTYPILRRLEDKGWLQSKWEEIDPVKEGRPPYRFYTLEGDAARIAHAKLAEKGFYSPSNYGVAHGLA